MCETLVFSAHAPQTQMIFYLFYTVTSSYNFHAIHKTAKSFMYTITSHKRNNFINIMIKCLSDIIVKLCRAY